MAAEAAAAGHGSVSRNGRDGVAEPGENPFVNCASQMPAVAAALYEPLFFSLGARRTTLEKNNGREKETRSAPCFLVPRRETSKTALTGLAVNVTRPIRGLSHPVSHAANFETTFGNGNRPCRVAPTGTELIKITVDVLYALYDIFIFLFFYLIPSRRTKF